MLARGCSSAAACAPAIDSHCARPGQDAAQIKLPALVGNGAPIEHRGRVADKPRRSASASKGKHVAALVKRRHVEGLSAGRVKNRLVHLRWWAEKVGKAGLVPADNTLLGIPQRQHVTNANKSKALEDALDGVRDAHVRMSR